MADSSVAAATNPFTPQSPPPSAVEPSPPQATEQVSTDLSLTITELLSSVKGIETKVNLIYQEVMALRYAMAVMEPRRKSSRGLAQYSAAIAQHRQAATRTIVAARTGGAAAAGGGGAGAGAAADDAETEKEN
jgi:hypothetical protein